MNQRLGRSMLEWTHSGFSVDASIHLPAGSSKTGEALAQYIVRPPVSLQHLLLDEGGTDTVVYRAAYSDYFHTDTYGLYSSRARGTPGPAGACAPRGWSRQPHLVRLAPEGWKRDHPPQPSLRIGPPEEPKPQLSVSAKQSRAAWARLIKKIYQGHPLCCPRCHKPMKIIAVITDPAQVLKILRHLINKGTPPPGSSRTNGTRSPRSCRSSKAAGSSCGCPFRSTSRSRIVKNQRDSESAELPQLKGGRLLVWLPLPFYIAAAAFVYHAGITAESESAVLLTALNTLFCTAASLFTVYLAGRSYLETGSIAVLLLGCGALALGATYLVAGQLMADVPVAVAFHNSGLWLAGAFFLASSISALLERQRPAPPAAARGRLAASCLGVLAAITLIIVAAKTGAFPVFFMEGRGTTALREVVLGVTVLEFLAAALGLGILYHRSGTWFLLWYCAGLAFMGLGMGTIALEPSPGTPLSWLGRSGQYAGGLYMLLAVLSRVRHSGAWRIPLAQALRASEDRYRALVDLSPDAILVHSAGRYVFANPAAARLLGASSPAEVVGRSVMELIVPEERAAVAQRIGKAYQGAKTPLRETRFIRLDGTMVDVEVTGIGVDFAGRPAVQIVAHDVTDRKRAEDSLRERERQLQQARDLLEAVTLGTRVLICTVDRDFRYTFFNREHHEELKRLTGKDTVIGMSLAEALADLPEEREKALAIWRRALAGETIAQTLAFGEPGRYRKWYSARHTPIRDEAGNVVGAGEVTSDITDLVEAQRALGESERRWSATLASIGDAVIATDTEGRIEFMNRVAEELTGWKVAEAERRLVTQVFVVLDADSRRPLQDPVTSVLQSGAITGLANHAVLVRKDGSEVPIDDSGAPIRDEEGRTTGVVLVFRDISRRKRAEEALLKAHSELEQRVRERTVELERRTAQLRSLALELTQTESRERKRLAGVLHDSLQQLLVGAKLRVELLQRQAAEAGVKESAQNVAQLLDESIRVSRSLTVELSPPILQEAGLVPAVRWLGRWMQEKHGLCVEVAADAEILTDPGGVSTLLFESVRELLFNVLKHAGVRQARVLIGLVGGGLLKITVADQGAGFDIAAVQARGSQAGFGLFSIRERIELLGGQVQIEAAPGTGVQVTLVAPMPAPPARAKSRPAQKGGTRVEGGGSAGTRPGNAAAIRVLVADDHRIMREGLAKLIQVETDMEVVGEAADGEQAVEMARRLHPQVVLMDLSMPKMNGLEATEKILSEMPDIRVIALSMYEKEDREETMRKAGAVAYLTKDGPSGDLIAAIRAAAAGTPGPPGS